MTAISVQKQGQSDKTEWKERGISCSLSIGMGIFWRKFGGKNYGVYQHFDLNSGSGINEDFDCIGSPLAFVREVDRLPGFRYRAHFVDVNPAASAALSKNPEIDRRHCYIHCGDNQDFCQAIPDIIDLTDKHKMAIGSVLIDPNGADVPIDEIALLSEKCPRIDFIVNWNSTAFKRCLNNPKVAPKGRLHELIEAANRSNWLIRRPVSCHQWTLLVGRNMATGDHRSMGFYHLDSPAGKEIFDYCNLTREEFDKNLKKGQAQLELVP